MESKEDLKSPGKSNPRIPGGWPGRSITDITSIRPDISAK